MKHFIATGNDEGVRLSRFVLKVTHHLPSSLLYKSFRNKRVKVNGKKGAPDQRLHEGDSIALYINDEFFSSAEQPVGQVENLSQTNVPFSVVWEDDSLAVLFKPAGILSHSDSHDQRTLIDAFRARQALRGEYAPDEENTFAPALCNRLDRGTEGLVIAAKTYGALRDMNERIRLNQVEKQYIGIVTGIPPEGIHEGFLARDKGKKIVQVAKEPLPQGKPIATGVRILESAGDFSLCEFDLLTGRTHQIRAHLAFLGTPLLGDPKYGDPAKNKEYSVKTQALCAYRLSFSGRVFTAKQSTVPVLWQQIKKSSGTTR